jgi:hypothetical protein
MNIFIICPVRNASPEIRAKLEAYVKKLESEGHRVHYPPRDTNQDDEVGLNICLQNLKAVAEADEVHVAWDNQSQGVLFDLGIAFTLNKPIRVIKSCFPRRIPSGKSFPRVIRALEKGALSSQKVSYVRELDGDTLVVTPNPKVQQRIVRRILEWIRSCKEWRVLEKGLSVKSPSNSESLNKTLVETRYGRR